MKLWYLLEPGDIIQPGDEVFVYYQWQPSAYIGTPVVSGAFRRATGGVEPNAPQQAQPAICRCGGSGWLRQSFLHEGDLPCPACNPCGTWQA